jgi:acylphosphatase
LGPFKFKMKVANTIRVLGKVQGVFYRASTKNKAEEYGVVGSVRNEKDGSVYIEVEGDVAAIKKFISWCETGPQGAKVDKILVEESVSKNYKSFEITR